jgi:hypothetical protein
MYTFVQDSQVVGNTTGTLFAIPQQGTVNAAVTLSCDGANITSYDFQQSPDGVTWSDIQTIGNPLNNTLLPGQQVSVLITSAYTQVRCIGFASGGSILSFSISRYFNRPSGGNCPLLGGI